MTAFRLPICDVVNLANVVTETLTVGLYRSDRNRPIRMCPWQQGHYLLVAGADLSVEVQSLLRLLKLASVQQVGTDHHAGAAFSGLAVDGGDVLLVLAQPLVQVFAEGLDELQLGRVVVLERILSDCRNRHL